MAREEINIGGQANDGTGDSIREAFDKTNRNFTELYGGGTDLSPLENRVGELENTVGTLGTSVTTIDTSVTTITNRLTETLFPVIENDSTIVGTSNYSKTDQRNFISFSANAFSIKSGNTDIPVVPQLAYPFENPDNGVVFLNNALLSPNAVSKFYENTYTLETLQNGVVSETTNTSGTFSMQQGDRFILEIWLLHAAGNVKDLYRTVTGRLRNASDITEVYYLSTVQHLQFVQVGNSYTATPELSTITEFSKVVLGVAPATSDNYSIDTILNGTGISNSGLSVQIANYGYRLLVIKK